MSDGLLHANLAYVANGTYDHKIAHLELELELGGLETDGQLPIPTIKTKTTKFEKKTKNKMQKSNKQYVGTANSQPMSLRNVGSVFVNSRTDRLKNKLLKDQMQKHTYPVHTAEKVTTQHICAITA